MQLSHTPQSMSAVFDDPNLVSSSGLAPAVALAESAGLGRLAMQYLSVPTDKGANADLKVSSMVAGMVAGADSIDDMALLRHGGMDRVFDAAYAPSTLGSFLRQFTFGHVRQLDAVASRFLTGLAQQTPLVDGVADYALVDVDDTIIEVHGHAKQGAGFGYSGIRGLNALLATVSSQQAAPVIVAQRLRKGAAGSPRGAKRLVADALSQVNSLRGKQAAGTVLVRADSAFYGHPTISTAVAAGADVSVTVRMSSQIKTAIETIDDDSWQTIEYTNAVFDDDTEEWISSAEVAEVPFVAFGSQPKANQVPGRLVVRRIPELNPTGQESLFEAFRYHAFFTTSDLDTVTADKTHRAHAIIEAVHADLKASALAHLPSGKFAANAGWLVCAVMAFNLTRAAATVSGPDLAKATTATIRRKLITVPARIASSARRIRFHLPANWPWQQAWQRLFHTICRPPPAAALS